MFVSFEGIDGSGKTTVLQELAAQFRAEGRDVCATREPGGSSLGPTVRAIVQSKTEVDLDPVAELFLFLADRAQHVRSHIRPALAAGSLVLCDRYTDSTRAYQGGPRGIDQNSLESAIALATGGLEPDLTILLDLDVADARARVRARAAEESRFDAYDIAFHEAVRQRYLSLAAAHPARFCIVPAARALAEVVADARAAIVSAMM